MWDLFDNEIGEKNECVYSSEGESKTKLVIFVNLLSLTDEGFLGCINNKCGIIYTDMIEQGAEWNILVPMIIITATHVVYAN